MPDSKRRVPLSVNRLRRYAVRVCRYLWFQRPFGLKRLGRDSFVRRPVKLLGRKNISIGNRTSIGAHGLLYAVDSYAKRRYSPEINIGDNVYIGRHVYLTAAYGITIENGSVLSEHVYITDLNHGFDPNKGLIMNQDLNTNGKVLIGPNCFLGYRVAVMPGVVLGHWCIVGANSVVTRSFPPYSMIAGSPARLIKVYSHEQRQWVPASQLKEQIQEQH